MDSTEVLFFMPQLPLQPWGALGLLRWPLRPSLRNSLGHPQAPTSLLSHTLLAPPWPTPVTLTRAPTAQPSSTCLCWLARPRGRLPGSGVEHLPTGPLTLCPSPPDRGTIHKVVESREGERSLVFNIMEIQPFHHPAAIQAMSLDTERVSLPCPLQPAGLPGGWGTELLCM